jgi:predicted O-methyltransferase YrrM
MTKNLKQILIEEKLTLELDSEHGTDKGGPKSYVEEYYEGKFLNFQEKKITLVEIGVRSGASLCLWKNYFSKKSKIYGVDNLNDKNINNIPINSEWISGENVEYIVGDAYDKSIRDKIIGDIDILIDDGPHTFESHVKLLELYVSKMKKGGIIIIEDISYDYNRLYDFVPEEYKKTSSLYDFGGYDNRLIEIIL